MRPGRLYGCKGKYDRGIGEWGGVGERREGRKRDKHGPKLVKEKIVADAQHQIHFGGE